MPVIPPEVAKCQFINLCSFDRSQSVYHIQCDLRRVAHDRIGNADCKSRCGIDIDGDTGIDPVIAVAEIRARPVIADLVGQVIGHRLNLVCRVDQLIGDIMVNAIFVVWLNAGYSS